MKKELPEVQAGLPNDENIAREKQLANRFNQPLKREEIYWLQRFKLSWIKEGDKNTAFFHITTLNRRRKSRISIVKLPSREFSNDEETIAMVFIQYTIQYSHLIILIS